MSRQVRASLIAGSWYPGNPQQLRQTIEQLFAQVSPTDVKGEVLGLISPHAGYVYSGQTAAYAYHAVRDQPFDTVVVISPVHRVPVGRFAITSADAYQTPLGLVPLDQDLVQALADEVPVNRVDYDGEHSLEIQLPFLQVAIGDLSLLPVMIGESSLDLAAELGEALVTVLSDRKALLVASTDMHHIDNYDQVVRRDQIVVDAIQSFDLQRVKKALSPWDCSVCGRVPVLTVMTAAQALGADGVSILHHTNSGDVTGTRTPGQYTVGYLAAALYRHR